MSAHTTDPRKLGERERKRQFWSDHIRDQERSGQAQRDYCQCHGLSFANFARWRGLALKARVIDSNPAAGGTAR